MIHKLLSTVNKFLSKNKLHIFIYHQVLETFDPLRPDEATADRFDWQMSLVKKYFSPLSLSEAVIRLRDGTLPDNAICITFDDGYVNNLTIAQPILKKYDIPACVYVATAFSENGNMWNDRILHLFSQTDCEKLQIEPETGPLNLDGWENRRQSAYELLSKLKYLEPTKRTLKVDQIYALNPDIKEQQKLMMTPAQIKKLNLLGIEIGAHTHSHPILKMLNVKEQRREILESKNLLESWLGKKVEHFAYPNGIWQKDLDHQTVKLVKDLGFKSAVITNWGSANAATSSFMLPRFTPWDRSPFTFHARIVKNNIINLDSNVDY